MNSLVHTSYPPPPPYAIMPPAPRLAPSVPPAKRLLPPPPPPPSHFSASLTEAFGDKENLGNDARAPAAATAAGRKLTGLTVFHRPTGLVVSAGACRPFAPPTININSNTARQEEAISPPAAPARAPAFGGGWATEKGERPQLKQRAAACKTTTLPLPPAARAQGGGRVSPPPPLLTGGGAGGGGAGAVPAGANSTAAVMTTLASRSCRVTSSSKRQMQPSAVARAHAPARRGGFADKSNAPRVAGGAGAGSIMSGTPYSRAARRVAVRAARAKGVAIPVAQTHTPAAVLCAVPSTRLTESTAASRAARGVYNLPRGDASVLHHPRGFPRRRSSSAAKSDGASGGGGGSGGVARSLDGGRGAGRYDVAPAVETRRKAVVARTTSSSGAGRKREIRERRGLALVVPEDEVRVKLLEAFFGRGGRAGGRTGYEFSYIRMPSGKTSAFVLLNSVYCVAAVYTCFWRAAF